MFKDFLFLQLVCIVYNYLICHKMNFCCVGPDHITIVLSLYDEIKLIDWSFNNDKPLEGPKWNGHPTYFIHYACANDIVPWDFWIDLEVNLI